MEQSSDRKGRDDDGKLGLLLLASEGTKHRLSSSHATDVDCCKQGGERSVDEDHKRSR